MGFGLEVEMIAAAHELDLLTSPYVFDEEQARMMVTAGADIVVAHMGLTTKGAIGAQTAMSLDQAISRVQSICDAARSVRSDVIVLCHGGPIAEPDDVEFVLSRTLCCRFLWRIQCRTAPGRAGNHGSGTEV